jgi:hypothetical protein
VYLAKHLVKFVKKVYDEFDDCIIVVMDKTMFNLEKNIIMCFVYIPLEGPTVYNNEHCGYRQS